MSEIVFSGHQPNFIPYMGVIYKMFRSDIFVLDDDVQYSSAGLHNANRIKVSGQPHLITIPVIQSLGDPINAVRICYNKGWQRKLQRTIEMSYSKARCYEQGRDLMMDCLDRENEYLVDMNIAILNKIVRNFGLSCSLAVASIEVPCKLANQKRNVYQCLKLGCNVYYSGVGGKAYNDAADYAENGIRLVYSDYRPVVYRQTGHGFIENLSVLDYVMNEGYALPTEWRNA